MTTQDKVDPETVAERYVPHVVREYNRLVDEGYADHRNHRDFVILVVTRDSIAYAAMKAQHSPTNVTDDGAFIWPCARRQIVNFAKAIDCGDLLSLLDKNDQDAAADHHEEWISYMILVQGTEMYVSYVPLESEEESNETSASDPANVS